MTRTTRTITWAMLCEAEPRLLQLERQVKLVKAGRDFCANEHWYGYNVGAPSFKAAVTHLVGWDRRNRPDVPAWLASPEAYDVAYEHLYDLLPNCKHPPRMTCA